MEMLKSILNGPADMTLDRYRFEALCDLLPEGFDWGDRLSPARLVEILRAAIPPGTTIAPAWRGYALLGSGQYWINGSAPPADPAYGAELVITLATDEDRASGLKVGEAYWAEHQGRPIEAEEMVIRIGFLNERGLFALEEQLRVLRAAHWPSTVPPEAFCECGDRLKEYCPGAWEPGCDLGANEKHAKAVPTEGDPT